MAQSLHSGRCNPCHSLALFDVALGHRRLDSGAYVVTPTRLVTLRTDPYLSYTKYFPVLLPSANDYLYAVCCAGYVQAGIPCSQLCKCLQCKNYENNPDRQALMDFSTGERIIVATCGLLSVCRSSLHIFNTVYLPQFYEGSPRTT